MKHHKFTKGFDWTLAYTKLPEKLESLSLGNSYNQTLTGVVFPPELQILDTGDAFNKHFRYTTALSCWCWAIASTNPWVTQICLPT